MTTLIGIKTNSGLDSIVIAADNQITKVNSNEEEISKTSETKLHHGDNWVMGNEGIYRREVTKFFGILKGYRKYGSTPEKARDIFENAVKSRDFQEVTQLNKQLRKVGVSIEDMPAFIFAVNKPSLELWWIDEYGNFQAPEDENEFDYLCLGSGEERVNSYIQGLVDDKKIDKEKISLDAALNIVKNSMRLAEKSPGTGMGYDLIVLTEKEIKSYGEEIKEVIEEAVDKKLESIAQYHEQQK